MLNEHLHIAGRPPEALESAAVSAISTRHTKGAQSKPGSILLVGAPNVGKSSIFNRLSGSYVTVSNYPGTSVGVAHGKANIEVHGKSVKVPIHDPPGLYSLLPMSEEERVARDAIFAGQDACILMVIDVKNLARQLPLCLRLQESGLPMLLALNMMDEARHQGFRIDTEGLRQRLGIPVIAVSALTGEGIETLRAELGEVLGGETPPPTQLPWDRAVLEAQSLLIHASEEMGGSLPDNMVAGIAAELVLEGDSQIALQMRIQDGVLEEARDKIRALSDKPVSYHASIFLRSKADEKLAGLVELPQASVNRTAERISRLLISPWTGVPILFAVLYLAFYEFVGVFGAGTVVGWLEEDLFGGIINPFFERTINALDPYEWVRKLLVGDYGILTLAITYAIALVLPVVFFFFLVFSVVEDSGYFPRLALLVDRLFKKIGLNGRAVIPMVLGFGCDTMATITTRTLETKRERILATLLLSLAIPCSAQLGLIMGLLGGLGFGVWLGYIGILLGIFILVGYLGSLFLPGESPSFHMELPPMRMPRLGNVLSKSFSRMRWYFLEVMPLFIYASLILWALDLSGGLLILQNGMMPLMTWLGLPVEAAESFLIGFFRRDFGAAGLFKLALDDEVDLRPKQVFVAAVTLTLFVPCIAQAMVMWKERGPKVAVAQIVFITVFAFTVGGLLNLFLNQTGWLA